MRCFHTRFSSVVSTVIAAAVIASFVQVQDLVHKAAAQKQPIFLHNGHIHTVSGDTIRGGGVLFQAGKIIAITKKSARPALPTGTRSIDLKGSHVYPGLITVHTSLGLKEIGAVPMSIDTTEVGDITPEVLANVAVNPCARLEA